MEKGVSYVVEKVDVGESGVSDGRVVLAGGKQLSLKQAKFFDVGVKRKVEVSEGDRILLQANDKGNGIINGKVVTVDHVKSDGSVVMREGVIVPSEYRQFTHGYVVTSHKSQGKTANHVVVAAAKLDEKAAYVATSRGRESCDIHTPDTEYLIAGARKNSMRVGVFDGRELMPSFSYGEQIAQEKPSVDQRSVLTTTEQTKKVEGKIAINEALLSLPSPAEKLRESMSISTQPPKLRSMHPMKNQSLRIRSFGEKMLHILPKPVRDILSAAMKTKVMEESLYPQKQHHNHPYPTMRPDISGPSFRF